MQGFWPFPVRTGILTGTSAHPLDGLHVPDYCVFCSYVLHTAHHEVDIRSLQLFGVRWIKPKDLYIAVLRQL